MKKSLLIIGLMTLFACNSENENLGVNELSNASTATSNRSGDIGAIPSAYLPHNLSCEDSETIGTIDTLPNAFSNFNSLVQVRTQYQPVVTPGIISLPELLVKYLLDRGVRCQQVFFNNNTSSYFANNRYKEFTFNDGKTTIPEDNGDVATFAVFPYNNYMDNGYASIIVQNAYAKIKSNMPSSAANSIKAIRIFYTNDYNCSDLQEDRRNLKIQVVYNSNLATQAPILVLEP